MAKENIPNNIDNQIAALRRHVEASAGLAVKTANEFEVLANTIHRRIGVLLSPTTLKRIWRYLDEPVEPRRSTLDVLAWFCGWRDFADFEQGNTPEIESGNLGGRTLRCGENILRGEVVRLFWRPSRVCDVEYLGGVAWKVVRAEGTRLAVGDTFNCAMIVSGEPLYLDNLVHEGNKSGVYVCGRKTGVTFEKIKKD